MDAGEPGTTITRSHQMPKCRGTMAKEHQAEQSRESHGCWLNTLTSTWLCKQEPNI